MEEVVKHLQSVQNEKDIVFENKVNILENTLPTLRKAVEEKDSQIMNLENLLNDLQYKLELKNENEKMKTKSEKFKCAKCDIESNFNQGLKILIGIKHTSVSKTGKDEYPRACELCEKELKDKKYHKHHMKTHSYKNVGLKCIDCSYLAE